MRVKVYYAGDKPCIQEVAISIASQIKINTEPLPPSYMPENLVLAFIGTIANGKKPDKRAIDFVETLNPKRTAAVALYCTSANGEKDCLVELREKIMARGIKVFQLEYGCHGKVGLMGKMPTPAELSGAAEFAQKCVDAVTNHTTL